MSLFDHNQQLYGYTANGKFFTSKLQAIAEAGSLDGVELYFLDNEWSGVDWSKEPTESMRELVDRRCRQIRDQYSHVSLLFSGGFDSVTILNGFIRNNLVIDELIFWQKEWLKDGDPEYEYAWRIGQEVKNNRWPNLRLTIYKRRLENLANFYLKNGKDWIYHPGEHYGLAKGIRDLEYDSIREIGGKNQRNHSVIIEGRDKPRLDFRDGRWYTTMNDALLKYCIANSNLQFYFDPQFPEIYVKQCHLMIRWLENNFDVTHELVHRVQGLNAGGDIYEQWNLALERDPVYLPVARTGIGKILQNSDHQIIAEDFKLYSPTAYKIWEQGVTDIKQQFGAYWNENRREFPTLLSQQHYIREFRPKNQ